jgi:hypothetical protein
MSERTVSSKQLFWALAIGCVGCIYLGAFLGDRHGRAEMKHWEETYYTEHPVVKEVPVVQPGACMHHESNGTWTKLTPCSEEELKKFSEWFPPAPAPKPPKRDY